MERNLRNDQSGCSVTISQTGLRYRTQQPRRVYLFRTISHNDRTVYYRTGNVLCNSDSILAPFFGKLLIIMGGFYPVRDIHHILMWAFILFAIVHIYLVFYHDYIEQRGETSSIIGGWKFIEEDIADKEEVTETAETITKIAKKG